MSKVLNSLSEIMRFILNGFVFVKNSLQFTGYENSDNNIKFLFHQVSLSKFDDYSDNEFLTKETCKEYLNGSKEHYFRK